VAKKQMITVRLTRELHSALKARAVALQVPLNTLCVNTLQAVIEAPVPPVPRLPDLAQLPTATQT